jgi:hypothetical protein
VTDALDAQVLTQAPELATIAALVELLVIVERALAAEHPTITRSAHEPHRAPPTLREARRLVHDVRALRRRVARYQRAVLAAIGSAASVETEFPF